MGREIVDRHTPIQQQQRGTGSSSPALRADRLPIAVLPLAVLTVARKLSLTSLTRTRWWPLYGSPCRQPMSAHCSQSAATPLPEQTWWRRRVDTLLAATARLQSPRLPSCACLSVCLSLCALCCGSCRICCCTALQVCAAHLPSRAALCLLDTLLRLCELLTALLCMACAPSCTLCLGTGKTSTILAVARELYGSGTQQCTQPHLPVAAARTLACADSCRLVMCRRSACRCVMDCSVPSW